MELLLMATSGNTLFDQAYKKYHEKEKKNTKTIGVIKSAILLSFYKVARSQTFLILNN